MERRGFFWLLMLLLFTSGILLSGSEQSDRISFFGNIIGAAGSIVGVYWTLADNRRQLEEQHRKEIIPFLLLKETTGGVKTSKKVFLSDKVKRSGKAIGGKQLDDKFSILSFEENRDANNGLFYLSFRLENVGLEAGFITKIDITGLSETYSTDNVGRYKGKILVSALPKEKCYIALKLKNFVKDMSFNNNTPNKLEVIFKYEDLSQNQYKVSKAIEFRKREDKIEIYGARDSRPELV